MFVVKAYLPVNESFGKFCAFGVKQTAWYTCSVNCKHAVGVLVGCLVGQSVSYCSIEAILFIVKVYMQGPCYVE